MRLVIGCYLETNKQRLALVSIENYLSVIEDREKIQYFYQINLISVMIVHVS